MYLILNLKNKYQIYHCIFFPVEITRFKDPPPQIDYTVGSSISMIYYSNTSLSSSELFWTTNLVVDDDTSGYHFEYRNPVHLGTVFSDVGAGVHTLTCSFYTSLIKVLGGLQVTIRGNKVQNALFKFIHMIFQNIIIFLKTLCEEICVF